MAVDFRAERGDLHFQASYTEPTFSLWRSPDQLFRTLFVGLAKYGLQLNDLKWGQSSGIGDVQLNFFLFNYAAVVRIKVDRAEIEVFDLLKIDEQHLQDATANLLQILKAHEPNLSFAAFVIALAYHGKLGSGTARDFTRALVVPPPDGPGPSTGAGAVFYYGPTPDRISSAVTIDLSSVVPDALFVRVHTIWNASRVGIDGLAQRTRQYAEGVLAGFGLDAVAGR